MSDEQIIELYLQRSEAAISETNQCYGPYCYGLTWALEQRPSG